MATKKQNIAKVRRLIESRTIDRFDFNSMRVHKASAVIIDDDGVAILLKNGKVVLYGNKEVVNIGYGDVDDVHYTVHIWWATNVFRDFKIISDKEYTDFREYLHDRDREQKETAELARLKALANQHGFNLVKKGAA
jgi:hypothetical protein